MKIGVTGTRDGLNDVQRNNITNYMSKMGYHHEFHHGDCQGVDKETAEFARGLGWRVVCHPPKSPIARAFFDGDEILIPKNYFERNRCIVEEVEFLLAVPKQNKPQKKGGTWYTIRYAIKKKKPYIIFYPDGQTIIHATKGNNLHECETN